MSKCGAICEVFSRVCGYFRPVTNWNKGKQEEFKERKVFEVKKYARGNRSVLCGMSIRLLSITNTSSVPAVRQSR